MLKLIGYGVNVKLTGEDSFSRYIAFDDRSIVQAVEMFQTLSIKNELNLWSDVEVERIFETEDGDFEYETMLTTEEDKE